MSLDLPREWLWQGRLRYLQAMKVFILLEYYGFILAVSLALLLAIPERWLYVVCAVCTMRVITAHMNANYVARSINALDQYTLYPFF